MIGDMKTVRKHPRLSYIGFGLVGAVGIAAVMLISF